MAEHRQAPADQGMRSGGLPARLSKRFPFFYGWVIVGVGVVGLLSGGPGQSSVMAVFMTSMLPDLGLSRSAISGAFTLGTLIAAVGMGPVGRLTDQFGGRVIMATGALLLGATCLFMASVDNLVKLVIGYGLLRLMVQGPITLTGTTLVAQWFVRQRGKAQGVVTMGLTSAFAIFPPLAQFLIDWLSWRPAWVAIGLLVWLMTLPPILLLVRSRPEELGLQPDGDHSSESAEQSGERLSARPAESAWTAGQAVRTVTFWLLSSAIAVTWLAGSGLNFHQVAILVEHGLSEQFAALMYTVAAVVSVPATIATGYLVDRLPARRLLVALLIIQTLSAWSIIWSLTPLAAVLYAALNGILIGSTSVINAVVFQAYYGRRHLGSIRGITMVVNVGASAFGPFPLGLARDLLGAYDPGLWLVGALPLVVALMLRWVKAPAAAGASTSSRAIG